ncbi:MAG: DUF1587 domain-containing protein [Verrucomicrobia bacterium]|nr:DUF1587 domain-containing protein [Verrucomicrobiota bacterium]
MITCTPHSTRLGARSALRHALLVGFLFLPGAPSSFAAGASGDTALDREFARAVRPFLNAYCSDCHNAKKHKGNLDLSVYTGVDPVIADYQRWDLLVERLKAAEMPPEDADSHPAPELRRGVIEWYRAFRKRASERTAGDPGPVLPRRLSNAEYDYSIRDLTGVDIRPAREFPVDPANQAGFDNSGESLTMSPALLTKYLEAARRVASHLTLTPDGFDFAPHPMMSDPDRDKYCVKRIVDCYQLACQPEVSGDRLVRAHRLARGARTLVRAEAHVERRAVCARGGRASGGSLRRGTTQIAQLGSRPLREDERFHFTDSKEVEPGCPEPRRFRHRAGLAASRALERSRAGVESHASALGWDAVDPGRRRRRR